MGVHGSSQDAARLVRRAVAGDPRAWDLLVERFANLVYSVARRSGLNADDAEDCSQSVFIKLHQHLPRIETPEALPGWLSVTAAREAHRLRRVSGRYVQLSAEDRTLDEIVASEEAAADEVAQLSLDVDSVVAAIAGLRVKCRELLTALYLETQPSYQEISVRLKIPVGSIGPTRARCIEALRSLLAKGGFFVSGEEPSGSKRSKR